MTDTEKRIRIAKWCGWTHLDKAIRITAGHMGWANAFWENPNGIPFLECPDYLNDLNAMHGVENNLDGISFSTYLDQLDRGTKFAGTCATARQRAEALLKVIGE